MIYSVSYKPQAPTNFPIFIASFSLQLFSATKNCFTVLNLAKCKLDGCLNNSVSPKSVITTLIAAAVHRSSPPPEVTFISLFETE